MEFYQVLPRAPLFLFYIDDNEIGLLVDAIVICRLINSINDHILLQDDLNILTE